MHVCLRLAQFRDAAGALLGSALLAASAAMPAAAAPSLSAGDVINLTDSATIQITGVVGPGLVSLFDVGIMPVTGVVRSGVFSPGLDGVGAFIRYVGTAVQALDPTTGLPGEAVYDALSYTLETYTGTAIFGRAADRTPTVMADNVRVVGSGSLISGRIGFLPDNSISGVFNVTVNAPFVNASELVLNVTHAQGDVEFFSPTAFTLEGGSVVGLLVPEPASMALAGIGLAAIIGATRRRRAA